MVEVLKHYNVNVLVFFLDMMLPSPERLLL